MPAEMSRERVSAPGEVRKGIIIQETSGPTGAVELSRLGVILPPENTGETASPTNPDISTDNHKRG
jgi:hypothetical protein